MMLKRFFYFVAGIVVLVAGALLFMVVHGDSRSNDVLTLYGNIDIRQVNTAFRVDGRLADMKKEEGDSVQKGDVLATLDDDIILNRLAQARAKEAQARATLDNAVIVNKRKQNLCRTKTIATAECDDSRMYQQTSEANLAYARSVLEEAEIAAADATLVSPEDGIVLIRILEPGTMIKAGVPVYTISLNKNMWVRAYLKETDLGRVSIGMPVQIMTDSSDKIYHGHIGFISPQAEFTPKNIETASLRTDLVYRTRIIIDDPDDALKQGMPVTVSVKTND